VGPFEVFCRFGGFRDPQIEPTPVRAEGFAGWDGESIGQAGLSGTGGHSPVIRAIRRNNRRHFSPGSLLCRPAAG